jgi:hypothetical protein
MQMAPLSMLQLRKFEYKLESRTIMGVRYEWADEHQIIMNIYIEYPWTWTEYNAVMTTLMPILRELKHPCATAVDCSRLGSLPRDGNFLSILMNVEKSMPANVFASVVVAAPYGVSVFMNMLMKMRPRAKVLALFTQTMEEAHQKIYARYQELYASLGEASVSNTKGQ